MITSYRFFISTFLAGILVTVSFFCFKSYSLNTTLTLIRNEKTIIDSVTKDDLISGDAYNLVFTNGSINFKTNEVTLNGAKTALKAIKLKCFNVNNVDIKTLKKYNLKSNKVFLITGEYSFYRNNYKRSWIKCLN